MSRHLMLIPSLACQAHCAYCFGPNHGPIMPHAVLDAAVDWIATTTPPGDLLELTFHGGEPLLAGRAWYERSLPLLSWRFGRRLKLHLQSNLWLLDDDYCRLFQEYDVSLGTSLDGPESINDAQRGQGYFRCTMRGVELARQHGLDVGFICTFTSQSAQRADEVFDFFLQQAIGFSIHAALEPLSANKSQGPSWSLSPQAHGELLTHMLDRYLEDPAKLRIGTLDSMCRSVSAGNGGICTFGDCLGKYLAVAPNGDIYTCQRFIGWQEFRLANVRDKPTAADLAATPAWRMFQERQERITAECGPCAHLNYCRGGCPYNALVASGGKFDGTLRDPHCPAYKQTFDSITDRALAEVFSQENMQAVVEGGSSKYGLMRKGRLLQIMRGGSHPQEMAKQARKAVAAVALAVSTSPSDAVEKLDRVGLVTDPARAVQSLTSLQTQLKSQSQGLVNAYLHVTYACNLACDHCYASSSPRQTGQVMSVESLSSLVEASARAGFGKVIITGGEPLAHPHRNTLLDALAQLRQAVKPMQIVLRTNLAYSLSAKLGEQILRSVDQIVVSVDGDEATHDTRRGPGTYARTVTNLKDLAGLPNLPGLNPRIVLAATLTAEQAGGPEGDAVRALGKELGVGMRFKPVLPLGRAAEDALMLEFYTSLDDESETLTRQANPRSTCGLGMNLYIAPDGESFPCYALMGAEHHLGNAFSDGLAGVLEWNNAYRRVTVDSNRQCQHCAMRYLCGGFCRAWGSSADPDAPPTDCAALYERAQHILTGALEALDVSAERWRAAGLP
ncbi:MAG: TIGR04083 family peptide-modifying radical SAM enzyme [Anaerolineae bacterium]|nr:TIGR04083 family peptide-modifying radical SAM enzyme [Anaerolineae bacterium]